MEQAQLDFSSMIGTSQITLKQYITIKEYNVKNNLWIKGRIEAALGRYPLSRLNRQKQITAWPVAQRKLDQFNENKMFRIPANRPPTHPGEMLLEEFLKPLEMTQVELAEKLGVSYPRVNELIHTPAPP